MLVSVPILGVATWLLYFFPPFSFTSIAKIRTFHIFRRGLLINELQTHQDSWFFMHKRGGKGSFLSCVMFHVRTSDWALWYIIHSLRQHTLKLQLSNTTFLAAQLGKIKTCLPATTLPHHRLADLLTAPLTRHSMLSSQPQRTVVALSALRWP